MFLNGKNSIRLDVDAAWQQVKIEEELPPTRGPQKYQLSRVNVEYIILT